MKKDTTNLWVHYEPEFSNASALVDALDPRHAEMGEEGWVFRGHADARWRLVPSALRPNAWAPLSGVNQIFTEDNDLRTQLLNEYWAVHHFAQEADRQGLQVPGYDSLVLQREQVQEERFARLLHERMGKTLLFPPIEWESLFAMAQHYGVPTRMLDWSESSHVAAYFAAVESAKALAENPRLAGRALQVWAINLEKLSFLGASDRWGQIHTVRAPWASNPNLRAQRGLFTVHRHTYRKGLGAGLTLQQFVELPMNADTRIYKIPPPVPLQKVVAGLCESAADEIREVYLAAPVVRCFSLPWREAPALLKELDRLGVSAASLFPGYQGVTRRMEELKLHR